MKLKGRSLFTKRVRIRKVFFRQAMVLIFSCIPSIAAFASLEPIRGRVTEVEVDRGEAMVIVPETEGIRTGVRGEVLSRGGAREVRVVNVRGRDVRVRARNEAAFESVRVGDTVIFFADRREIVESVEESLKTLDELLGAVEPREVSTLEMAPDLAADVTGDILIDYEAWLLQLESEESAIPEIEKKKTRDLKDIPFYPNRVVEQRLRIGTDYDRTVADASAENSVDQFVRWNVDVDGEWWEGHTYRFGNEMEWNEKFFFEEIDYRVDHELPNGNRYWWRNRAVLKSFARNEGDSFLFNDFEARFIRKLSEEWEWELGGAFEGRHEYEANPDGGFMRGRFISEWNYRKGYDTWMDIGYELTREVRNATDDHDQNYWEHLLNFRYFHSDGDWEYYVTGLEEYRDFNQANNQSDQLRSEWFGEARKRLSDEWAAGLRGRIESDLYRLTDDFDSNRLLGELEPFLDYTGETLSLSFAPRFAYNHFLGSVPGDVVLLEGEPRKKSDGDSGEVSVYISATWFPNNEWFITASNDLSYQWFPHGETGAFASYLDAELLANSYSNFASLSIRHQCSEAAEISIYVSHSIQRYTRFNENDFETFHAGIEWLYRF